MPNLTENRSTAELHVGGIRYNYEATAATQIFRGALTALDADGNAVPAGDTANITVVGRAESAAAANDKLVIRRGTFLYDNGTDGETLSKADINQECYALDDHTVGKVGGTNKIKAGIVLDVTEQGVVVMI